MLNLGPSWRTSLGGIIGAVGAILMQVSTPPRCATLGHALAGLATVIIGLSARDANVSSEQQGAKK
jgi:NAD/NADP transhydrogenase beta subunit